MRREGFFNPRGRIEFDMVVGSRLWGAGQVRAGVCDFYSASSDDSEEDEEESPSLVLALQPL